RCPDPGPARLLRRAHVPPYGPRGNVPHAVGAGPFRGDSLEIFLVPNGPGTRLGDRYSRYRQKGCPAGSRQTRTSSCGWKSATVAPWAIACATLASRSSTLISRCIIIGGSPGPAGQTGRT